MAESDDITRIDAVPVKTFGHYRLVGELGRGGMGVVYKAYDTKVDRFVALKVLRVEDRAESQSKERFFREARVMAQLAHPNIVRLYDHGVIEGECFFSMELVEGVTLKQFAGDSPSVQRVAEVMVKVGDAVHYAHRQGVIHRDLKPENIMIDRENEPIVMDFGLAKLARSDSKISRSGMVLGTLQYMSPEQAQGHVRAIDERSDVYSLGAVLYELLTGQPPFHGASLSILYQIAEKAPPPPSKLSHLVPKDLEKICLKCLEKNKNDRYPSAAAFVDELARFCRGDAVQAQSSSLWGRVYRKAKRNKALMVVSLTAAALLFFSFGLFIWQLARERDSVNRANQQLSVAKEKAFREWGRAQAALKEAQDARSRAEDAERQTAAARQEAEVSLYYLSVILADNYLKAGDLALAEQVLSNCREDMRHWEWHWLRHNKPYLMDSYRHPTRISCSSFSQDGKIFAAGGEDGKIYLWDTTSRENFLTLSGHEGVITGCALARDGRIVASSPDRFTVWDASGQLRCTVSVPALKDMALSPDTKTLATGGDKLRVWDVESGRLRFEIPSLQVSGDCAFSPDGKSLIFSEHGKFESMVKVWDLTADTCLKKIKEDRSVKSCCFSPDGRHILIADSDGRICLRKTADWTIVKSFAAHVGAITCCAFSIDGKKLASAAEDRIVKIWDFDTIVAGRPSPVTSLSPHISATRRCVFSPCGKYLSTVAWDDTPRIWHIENRLPKPRMLPRKSPVTDCTFSPDGKKIATVGALGVSLWDTRTGAELFKFQHPPTIRCCSFSPDGSKIAAGGKLALPGGDVPILNVWDVADGKLLHQLEGHASWVNSCHFSPDGKTLISCSHDRTLKRWDLSSGRCIATMPAKEWVYDCDFSPDGRYVVYAQKSSQCNLGLWEMAGNTLVWSIAAHGDSTITCAFSSDGSFIASGGDDNAVKIWDREGKLLRSLAGHTNSVTGLGISSDGNRLVSASLDQTVKIWNVQDGREILTLTSGNHAGFTCCAFSPDNRTIIAGEDFGTVAIWDNAGNE